MEYPINRYVSIDGTVYNDGDYSDAENIELTFEDQREYADEEQPEDEEDNANRRLDWVNNAYISADADSDSVTVGISVGDPRGAFTLEIRRTGDGRLVMHVPYAGMGAPHAPLRELHPGTFEVCGDS